MASDEQMMQALQQRSGPPKWVFALAALGAVVAVGAVAAATLRGDPAAAHFSAFERCLIGEPLRAEDNVFFRLREVQLGQSLAAETAGSWPARCEPHATALFRAIDGSGKTALLKRLLREQLGCEEQGSLDCRFPKEGHLLGKADELWKAAEVAELERVSTEVTAPAVRLAPVLKRPFADLASTQLAFADHRFAENGELWLLFKPRKEGAGKARFCRVAKAASKATCRDIAGLPHLVRGATFLDGAEPPAVSGKIVGAEGVLEDGAYSLVDGNAVKTRGGIRDGLVTELREQLYLLKVQAGEVVQQHGLGKDKELVHPFHGFLVWGEVKDDDKALYVQPLSADAALVGEPRTLSERLQAGYGTRWQTCDGGAKSGALVARRRLEQSTWLLHDGKWSQELRGKLSPKFENKFPLACSPGRATSYWVERGAGLKLGRLDCRASGCIQETTPYGGAKINRYEALTRLGDKTLLITRSVYMDVRMRLAPFAALGPGPPTLIMDSFEYSGPKFENAEALVGADRVVMLFDDEKSFHAFGIDDQGNVSAISL